MTSTSKVKDIAHDQTRSAFRRYRDLVYGNVSLSRVIISEFLDLFVGRLPGALGLVLRGKLYPRRFAACGRGVVFGRGLTLRHAHKISIGAGTILDDDVVLDAKGDDNRGIEIGERVYIGRHSIVYCKNANINIGDRVNIASNCQVFSAHTLEVGADTVIGAYTYLLSGGTYDPADQTPFSAQSGMQSARPLSIGNDCWLGARVTIIEGAHLGTRCVIGAGAVVTRPIEARNIAAGVPARILRGLPETKQ